LISYDTELIFHSMSMLSLISTITSGNAAAVIEHEIYLVRNVDSDYIFRVTRTKEIDVMVGGNAEME
jgi:hypothetical protein